MLIERCDATSASGSATKQTVVDMRVVVGMAARAMAMRVNASVGIVMVIAGEAGFRRSVQSAMGVVMDAPWMRRSLKMSASLACCIIARACSCIVNVTKEARRGCSQCSQAMGR